MEIKFDVYFKKNLGTLCKDNEVDLDGKEAYVNIDLNLVDRLEVNYSVGGTKYTDEVIMKDIEAKEILIPFKSDVVKKGLNEFEVVAYMKNGDIKVSQTYTYNIEKSIGEGKQTGSGGSSDGHTHNNLNVLNSITQAKVSEWNNKADVNHAHSNYANAIHSHNDYASKIHTHSTSEIEGLGNVNIDLSDYYTKEETYNRIEIDNKIANMGTGGSVDLSNYYTKTETDEVANSKADINHIHSDYANLSHAHSEYANVAHSHNEYANRIHTHNVSEIEGIETNRGYSISSVYKKICNPFEKTYIKLIGDSVTFGTGGTGSEETGLPIGNNQGNSNTLNATCWANMFIRNIDYNFGRWQKVSFGNEHIEKNNSYCANYKYGDFVINNNHNDWVCKFNFYGEGIKIGYNANAYSGSFNICIDGVDNIVDATEGIGDLEVYIDNLELSEHEVVIKSVMKSGNYATTLKYIKVKKELRVKNHGKGSMTSNYIFNEGVIEEDDDVLIVMFGLNHVYINDGEINIYNSYAKLFEEHSDKSIIIMTPNPYKNTGYKTELQNIELAIIDVCNRYNIEYISNYDFVLNYISENNKQFSDIYIDACHPNDAGHKLIYNNIINKLGVPLSSSAFSPLIELSNCNENNLIYSVRTINNISKHEISSDNGSTYVEFNPIWDKTSKNIYRYNNIGIGEYKLRVTDSCGLSNTIDIVIESSNLIPITGISLDKTSVTVNVGSKDAITANLIPVNTTQKNIVWETNNELVASVSSGVITGNSEGECIVTARSLSNHNICADCVVTVKKSNVSVESVSLNITSHSLRVDEILQLNATILPSEATNKNVSWLSSNDTVATVVDGLVTAKSDGNCIITVTTQDGNKTATCNISVETEQGGNVSKPTNPVTDAVFHDTLIDSNNMIYELIDTTLYDYLGIKKITVDEGTRYKAHFTLFDSTLTDINKLYFDTFPSWQFSNCKSFVSKVKNALINNITNVEYVSDEITCATIGEINNAFCFGFANTNSGEKIKAQFYLEKI